VPVLNIAEGAGELAPSEKSRFYRIARRSAVECAAILDIAARLGFLPASHAKTREDLVRLVGAAVRLIQSCEKRSVAVRLDLAWPSDTPALPLGHIVDLGDLALLRNPLHGAQRDAGELGDVRMAVPSLQQDLDCVTLQHAVHLLLSPYERFCALFGRGEAPPEFPELVPPELSEPASRPGGAP
jgi:hypothetical protein